MKLFVYLKCWCSSARLQPLMFFWNDELDAVSLLLTNIQTIGPFELCSIFSLELVFWNDASYDLEMSSTCHNSAPLNTLVPLSSGCDLLFQRHKPFSSVLTHYGLPVNSYSSLTTWHSVPLPYFHSTAPPTKTHTVHISNSKCRYLSALNHLKHALWRQAAYFHIKPYQRQILDHDLSR